MKKVLTLGVVITTILWTMGVAAFVPVASAATLSAGDLIRASGPAVYFYAADGKRYTFPTEATYKTWYTDFSGVKRITDDELAAIDLAGNIVVRPGTKLVKITTVPKVFAVEPNGQLTWLATEAAAKALYGNDWAKKVIDVPDGFWVNYTNSGKSLDGTAYPTGQLIKYASSADVYRVNADGTKSLVTTAGMTANSFKSAFVVTAPVSIALANGAEIAAKVSAYADVSQGGGIGTVVTPVVAGALAVALSSVTPGASTVPTNATAAAADVTITKLDLTAGSTAVTVSSLKVTRSNLSLDAGISNIKLFDGTTQLGTSQSLNSNHQAVFNGLSLVVPANGTKTITLAATFTLSANYNGNIIVLGIESASDITATGTVSGTFPIRGNSVTLNSGVTIGSATLYDGALGSRNDTDLTLDTDAKDVRFFELKVTAGSPEPLKITQLTAIKNGTAAITDVGNLRIVNSDTGATLATVATLNSSGRAVFDVNVDIAKGGSANLSLLGDMQGTGAGRTLAFDLHDGTAYTIAVKGVTYGYGILPTNNNFCTAGVCTVQNINQGYLTVNLSGSSPATGNIAPSAVQTSLLVFDYAAYGEAINVTNTAVKITVATAEVTQITNVTLYNEAGAIVAGPQNPAVSGTAFNLTDSYTVPAGSHKYTLKADIASDVATNDTVFASMAAGAITGKGASSGKTTWTTSGGATVPPASVVTGKTMTVKAGALKVTTLATPVAGSLVVNGQDATFAYFNLDASAGGEDAKISTIIVTDTLGGAANAYTGVKNLELWGDPDTSDAVEQNIMLETTSATSTNANTVTFTFKTPLIVSKLKSSTLTLKADIVTFDTDGGGAADTHTYKIADTAPHVIVTGRYTGNSVTESPVAGAGQAQTIREKGTLLVNAAAGRAVAAQYVAGTTGNTMMSYKLESTYEQIDVTDFYIATTASSNASVAAVKLYANGVQIGQTSGYSLDSGGDAHVVLDSGTFIVPISPAYIKLDIKVDLTAKADLVDAATLEIGIGDADYDDGDWGANGAASAATKSYGMVATGRSSGSTLTQNTITSLGVNANGTIIASYVMYLYDGVLIADINSATPSGTATPSTNKEVLRFNLQAVGDDITVNALEFCLSGTATNAVNTPTGTLSLKDVAGNNTYGDITMTLTTDYDAYWSVAGLAGAGDYYFTPDNAAAESRCLSFGDGSGMLVGNVINQAMEAFDIIPVISAGTTQSFKVTMDTTGITANETLQMTLGPNPALTCGAGNDAACAVTTSGIEWQNSTGTDVDALLTKNLPVQGGSLIY